MTAFTIPAGQLHAAVECAARATPARTPMPALAGVLLDAHTDADQITVSGFDRNVRATLTVAATVTTPGRMLVSGRLLAAVTKTAGRADALNLDDADGPVRLVGKRARWTLPALPIEEYPPLPELGVVVGTVTAGEFARAVRRVLPAAAREKAPPAMTAVKLEGSSAQLTLVATDRYRLAVATIDWRPTDPDRPFEQLVPAETLDTALRTSDGGPSPDVASFTVSTDEHGCLFGLTTPDSLTAGRLVAVEYPRWRQLLPQPSGRSVTVPTAELTQAISQVIPAIDAPLPILTLTTTADTLTVSVAGDDRSAEASLTVELIGEPITIHVNGNYLKDALACADAEHVTIHFGSTDTRPMLIHGEDSDRYQHLLCPSRDPGSIRAKATS